jgi:hypothetical protein
MNRQARRAAASEKARSSGRKPSPQIHLRRWEKGCITTTFVFVGSLLLFLLAAVIVPRTTGRCLKCVVTGNYRCAWLLQQLPPRNRSKGF